MAEAATAAGPGPRRDPPGGPRGPGVIGGSTVRGMAEMARGARMMADDRERLGAQLEKDYGKGRSMAELAEGIGTSQGRVRTILLERGVVLRPRGGAVRKPDPKRQELAATVAGAYGKGESATDLADRHGVSAGTIRNLVKAGGGTLRPRGGRRASS